MMKTYSRKTIFLFIATLFLVVSSVWRIENAYAATEEAMSITVTPPFFQLRMDPGKSWRSSIKVVNTNKTPLTVYASPMDFSAGDEEGHATFRPLMDIPQGSSTLASWLSVSGDPFTIEPGKSREIPFSLVVPLDASPGGHYAAILIGTKSLGNVEGSALHISSFVSALFFLRVSGDAHEALSIKEFSASHYIHQAPQTDFVVRVENKGNVHIQPQGSISVSDMWGREVAHLSLNQQATPVNVLPGSIRKFSLSWGGSGGILRTGRYVATLTLAYGSDSRKNISQTIVFWYIPIKEIATTLILVLLALILVRSAIRKYIARSLRAELSEVKSFYPHGIEKGEKKTTHASERGPLLQKGSVVDLSLHTKKQKSEEERR